MTIDYINKKIAAKTGISEKEVAAVNKFYWNKVKEHIYEYNPNPVNINNLCVIYPNKHHVKRHLLKSIDMLRYFDNNKRYKKGSPAYKRRKDYLVKRIRALLKIRKENKFTN